jgi:hypothetical protein
MGDDLGALIFLAIFIIVMAAKGIKTLAQAAGAQAEKKEEGKEGGVAFRAPLDKIQQFMQSLEAARQPEQPPAPKPAVPEQPEARSLLIPEEALPAVPFVEPHAAEPITAPPRAERHERPRPPKRRRARRRSRDARGGLAEQAPQEAPAQAEKEAGALPVTLRGRGLRQAIVWSEVLGRPVSMRARRGPGSAGRQ